MGKFMACHLSMRLFLAEGNRCESFLELVGGEGKGKGKGLYESGEFVVL